MNEENNYKYFTLVKKLINKTKDGEYIWKRISNHYSKLLNGFQINSYMNHTLSQFLSYNKNLDLALDMILEKSYILDLHEGYVIIISMENENNEYTYKLIIQSNPDAVPTTLELELLEELASCIEKSINNIDNFINSILNE